MLRRLYGLVGNNHVVLEAGGSNPGFAIYCKFYSYIPRGEAVNCRPYAFPSFEVVKPRKITAISAIMAKGY